MNRMKRLALALVLVVLAWPGLARNVRTGGSAVLVDVLGWLAAHPSIVLTTAAVAVLIGGRRLASAATWIGGTR
jgi:hypothetical protein